MVAGVPDWGWPPGSASTTTGLGADPWPGGAGVGSGSGFGSGKATPVFMRTAHAALGGVAAPVARIGGARVGVGGVGHDVPWPGGGAVGRRLAEGGPAEGREVPGQHGGVEGEREALAAARDRRGDGCLRTGALAGEVLAVGGRERAVEGAECDVDGHAIRVAGRHHLVVGNRVAVDVEQDVHAEERALRAAEGARVEAHGELRRGIADIPRDGAQVGLARRARRRVAGILARLHRRARRGRREHQEHREGGDVCADPHQYPPKVGAKASALRQALFASSTYCASDASMPSATTSRSGIAS